MAKTEKIFQGPANRSYRIRRLKRIVHYAYGQQNIAITGTGTLDGQSDAEQVVTNDPKGVDALLLAATEMETAAKVPKKSKLSTTQ